MKKITLFLAMISIAFTGYSQQINYSKVKVLANENQLLQMAEAGIDITEGLLKKDVFFISDFSSDELERIAGLGLEYEVLIPDVAKFYVDQNAGKSTSIDDYKGVSEWEIPENFEFGSMSGHCTWQQMIDHLDNMATLFPNLITIKQSIGQSIEGRDLWMVKISDNPNQSEDEPQVLYTALHHAREPAGMMTLLFYMYYVLENYETDPFIHTLVNNTEMYFVPVLNPDGYVYNQTTNPNGGGMWRKNRRNNSGTNCDGVDLNRNYSYQWGIDNTGSSPDPCDETYRGESPFSEPEMLAISNFVSDHSFKNALNYHTYSNLLLYAWGYTEDPSPDDAIFYAHSVLYTQDNHFTFGAGSTTIYPTNGGSDDWMYGEESVLSYTPELGGDNDGFWCPINRIVPIAQENMIQNLLIAAFAGSYADMNETTPPIISETSGYLTYDITRLGLKDGATFTVSWEPISEMIISGTEEKSYSDMAILESISDSVPYTLNIGTPSGTPLVWIVSVDNGDYILTDTVSKIFGQAVVIFEDDGNTMANWTSSVWNNTTEDYHSATKSITDSPFADYPDNTTSTVTMNSQIDLTEAGYALLQFWGKWEIEQGWDYVQLLISTNNGGSWEALEGQYTVTGNGNQLEGEPLYDGFQTQWVEETVDLGQYIGQSVKFRFLLHSDFNVHEDGFYFDDFSVSTVEVSPVGISDKQGMNEPLVISQPFPNPANNSVSFYIDSEKTISNLNLKIFNATGQEVYSQAVNNSRDKITIPVQDWNAGIYYYQLSSPDYRTEAKKLFIY